MIGSLTYDAIVEDSNNIIDSIWEFTNKQYQQVNQYNNKYFLPPNKGYWVKSSEGNINLNII